MAIENIIFYPVHRIASILFVMDYSYVRIFVEESLHFIIQVLPIGFSAVIGIKFPAQHKIYSSISVISFIKSVSLAAILMIGLLFWIFNVSVLYSFSKSVMSMYAIQEFFSFDQRFLIIKGYAIYSTIIIAVLIMVLKFGANFKDIGIVKSQMKFSSIILMILLILILEKLFMLLSIPENTCHIRSHDIRLYLGMSTLTTSSVWFYIYALMLIVVAPLSEELIWRGAVFTVCRRFIGPVHVVVIQAIFFTCSHINMDLKVYPIIFMSGLLYGYLRVRTESIYPSIILHCLGNLVAFLFRVSFIAV